MRSGVLFKWSLHDRLDFSTLLTITIFVNAQNFDDSCERRLKDKIAFVPMAIVGFLGTLYHVSALGDTQISFKLISKRAMVSLLFTANNTLSIRMIHERV